MHAKIRIKHIDTILKSKKLNPTKILKKILNRDLSIDPYGDVLDLTTNKWLKEEELIELEYTFIFNYSSFLTKKLERKEQHEANYQSKIKKNSL